jgi:hypothetical protein
MKNKVTFGSAVKAGLFAGLTATAINVILFFIFHATGIISDTIFIQPGQPMTVVPIIMSSLIPSIIASMVFFLFEKFTKNGYRIFMIISIVLMLVTFINPFVGIPGVTTGYAIALDVMHVFVVVPVLFFISREVKKVNA